MTSVAGLQIGSHPGGTAATVDAILSYEQESAASRATLVVMPEAPPAVKPWR